MEYVGRNETPPMPVELNGYDKSPGVGWLVFKQTAENIDQLKFGIRDVCGAFPIAKYQQWDVDGNAIEGTLCLPPEMCGFLNLPVGDSEDERDEAERPKQTKEEPSPAESENKRQKMTTETASEAEMKSIVCLC